MAYDNIIIDATERTETITSDETDAVSFTNTRLQTGNLTITKTLQTDITAEQSEVYYIDVVLSGTLEGYSPLIAYSPASADTPEGTLTLTNGKVTIPIHGGQTATITRIPKDATYTVTEPGYDDRFDTTINDDGTGSIAVNAVKAVQVTNTRRYCNLTIEKKVEGKMADPLKPFTFNVAIDSPDPDAYTYSITGDGQGNNATIGKSGTFTLAHNQSVTIARIPSGAQVTVTETRGYYTTTWALPGVNLTPENTEGARSNGTSKVSFKLTADGTLKATNHLDPVSPTGAGNDTEAFAAMGFASLLALALVFANRRRKRRGSPDSGPGGGGLM